MKLSRLFLTLAAGLMISLAADAAQWQMKQGPMTTPWTDQVNPECPLPEYPRPQMVRDNWMNLNGVWDLRKGVIDEPYSADFTYDKAILVPFPIESPLSGVMEKADDQCYWYRRTFSLPAEMQGKNILLNFGAVDWEAIAYVNGTKVGRHTGGYDPFTFDITDAIDPSKDDQELVVYIYDNTGVQGQPTGKQSKNPSICWYTANSGIWQTVWIEAVDPVYIQAIEMEPNVPNKALALNVTTSSPADITVTIRDKEGNVVATANGKNSTVMRPVFESLHLWSPDDPYLYDLEIVATVDGKVTDRIESYCGMRKIEVKKVDGLPRIFLNDKQIFQIGTLDQGFWPDGIYTAPSDEALIFDIQTMKDFSFNMVRKHIKVEPARWYYHCDRMGILVWQDLPSGNVVKGYEDQAKANFRDESVRVVNAVKNSPSIVHWVVFNEGWGQFDTNSVTSQIDGVVNHLNSQRYGKTSLICCASGWTDSEIGNIIDTHSYPYPSCPSNANRAAVCGEYGGITLKIPGHIWPGGDFQYIVVETGADFSAYFNMLCDKIKDYYYTGLNAAVYTEIADVEIEKNGFLTYDRKVLKPANPETVKAKIEEVIAMPHNDIIIKPIISTADKHRYTWSYKTTADVPRHWYEPGFDDSSWSKGVAAFGDGMPSSQRYLVGTPWSTSQIYMRRWFYIGDLTDAQLASLRFMSFHDDDIAIYINGVLAGSQSGCVFNYSPIDLTDGGRAALQPNAWNLIAVAGKQGGGQQIMDLGISAFVDEDFEYTECFDSLDNPEVAEFPAPGTAENPKYVKVANPVPAEKIQSGKGSATATGQFWHTADRSDVAWADYDNDGYLDLVYSGRNGHKNVSSDLTPLYINKKDGTFERVTNSMAPCFYASPVAFDFNNDGLVDIFMPGLKNYNYGTDLNDIAAYLYENKGNGRFEEVNNADQSGSAMGIAPIYNSMGGGRGRHWAAAADYDNDGWTDLVVIGRQDYLDPSGNTDANGNPVIFNDNRVLHLYKNIEGKRFELQENPLHGDAPLKGLSRGSVWFSDMDSDGLVDIVASGYGELEGNLCIYWNNGDGTFESTGHALAGSYDAGVFPADFDADGLMDILVTGFANPFGNGSAKAVFIHRNVGNRTFTLLDDDFCGFEGVDGSTPDVADVNHDGLPDILIGGHGKTHEITTWLYVNQGDFYFKPYGAYYDNPFGKKFQFDRISHGNSHLVDVDNDGQLDAWSAGWAHSSACSNECGASLYKNSSDKPNVAPSVPSDLKVTFDKATRRFIFTWAPAADDVTPAEAIHYNFYLRKVGSDNIYMTVPADIATGRIKVGLISGQINTTSFAMPIPADETEYEWGVQAIDNGNLGGQFAKSTFKASENSGIALINSDSIRVTTAPGVIDYRLDGIKCALKLYDIEGVLIIERATDVDGRIAGIHPGAYILNITAPGAISKTFKLTL